MLTPMLVSMLTSTWAVALEISWKSAVILAAACVASLLLRRASAAVRHAVWALALGSLLLLPALQVLLPAWRPAALAATPIAGSEVSAGADAAQGAMPQSVEARRSTHQSPQLSPVPWRVVAIALWMAGAGVCLLRWRNGTRQVTGLRRSAAPPEQAVSELARESALELRLRRPVVVLIGEDGIVPMATGLVRPAVLLPGEAALWSRERLRIVLLHEMAHIRRRDCFTQALAELAGALYWFNPLVWVAIRRLRIERERASDDLVLSVGNKASDYAAHLLALARPLESRELASAAIAMASSSHLETRLRSILNPRLDRRALTRVAGVTASAIALCLVLPLAAMRPQAGDARTVSGTVYDAAGARVPGASIIAVGPDSGQELKTATDQEGNFSVGPLSVGGAWRITVEAPGFASRIQRVDRDHFEFTLDVAQSRESVVVRGKGTAAAAGGPHRVRVGGNVVPAKVVYKVDPEYPDDVRSRGIHGDVVLRAVVSLKGTILSLASVSSPDPQLTEAAINAVREWRYQPSLLNGEPIETATTITVNFQLEP